MRVHKWERKRFSKFKGGRKGGEGRALRRGGKNGSDQPREIRVEGSRQGAKGFGGSIRGSGNTQGLFNGRSFVNPGEELIEFLKRQVGGPLEDITDEQGS